MTSFAVGQLGEVVSAEWPEQGMPVKAEQSIGTVESVKTVADLYAPIDGTILEINPKLIESLNTINRDPEGEGWIAILEIERPAQWDLLLTHEQYQTWMNEGESK